MCVMAHVVVCVCVYANGAWWRGRGLCECVCVCVVWCAMVCMMAWERAVCVCVGACA